MSEYCKHCENYDKHNNACYLSCDCIDGEFFVLKERTCKAIPTMDEIYIRMPATCSLCGNRMADHDKFCATCGAKVVKG